MDCRTRKRRSQGEPATGDKLDAMALLVECAVHLLTGQESFEIIGT